MGEKKKTALWKPEWANLIFPSPQARNGFIAVILPKETNRYVLVTRGPIEKSLCAKIRNRLKRTADYINLWKNFARGLRANLQKKTESVKITIE